MANILDVKNLRISFRTNNGTVKAVRDISFSVEKGKTLAIVGESGSGKSVTSRAILGISAGNAIIESGEIIYDGKDLLKCSEEDMYHIRGDKIAMIFQDPLSSLNPIVRIGKQITEAMLLKNKAVRKEAEKDFNLKLKQLNSSMHKAAIREGLDETKIDAMTKTFDDFNMKANELQNDYCESYDLVEAVLSDIKEMNLYIEHKQKIDLRGHAKTNWKRLSKVNNQYFLYGVEEIIYTIRDIFEVYYKDTLKRLTPEQKANSTKIFTDKLKGFEKDLEEILSRDRLNFFRLGYYVLRNPEEDLSKYSFEEINAKSLELLDSEFMPEFKKYTEAALRFNVYDALKYKKEVVTELKNFKEFINAGNFTKKDCLTKIKALRPLVNASIDPLKTVKDSAAYIICNSLTMNVKKYFSSIKANEKDAKRFARQDAAYQAKLAKGKKIDYKIVPQKIISLESIVNDMNSSIDVVIAKYESSISKFDGKEYGKWEKVGVLLIDYLKERASQVVFKMTKTAAKEKAIKLMEEVSIPEARARFRQYPFEFSGGMRQRIVIAIALSADPEILICDEPTTALDVTIQSQILELINKLKAKRNLSIIFITHDLGVVANMADQIAVMYAGKIVEYGTSEDIFYSPAHPYTWALLSSMPDLDTKEKLEAIPGTPPNMIYPPVGDAFAMRNKYALKIDFEEQPPMFKISDTHYAATWLLDPRAPKVEIPKVIRERIERMKKQNKAKESK